MNPSNQSLSKPSSNSRSGLTRVEVLVLSAVLAVLAGLLLMNLVRHAPPGPKRVSCMSNVKQLTTAWLSYAADNQGQLMPNPGWVKGVMNWNPDNPDNTDFAQLLDPDKSLMAPYVHSVEIFKCPADDFTSQNFKERRVRSYSLNGVLAGPSGSGPTAQGKAPRGRTYYGRNSQETEGPVRIAADLTPRPAMIFTFLCEHPDSLNDGGFLFDPGYPPGEERWRDLPSSHHPGPSCPIAFADGHAEIHQWLETRGTNRTVYPVTLTNVLPWLARPAGTSRDYQWMQDRMPYL